MRNRFATSLILLVIIISSCWNTNNKKLTISEEKLVKVFYDLHAAQNIVNQSNKSTRDSLTELYTQQIFKIHQVSKEEFEKNIEVLQSSPNEFKEFYKKLETYGDTLMQHTDKKEKFKMK